MDDASAAAKHRPSTVPRGLGFWIKSGLRRHHITTFEALLCLINLGAVFAITRHLFTVNSSAIYWGWDPQSLLAFIGLRHRFSDIWFGLGSDPVIGIGNVSYALNPNWF